MHRSFIIIMLLICAAFCLAAGCTQPRTQGETPPAPVTTPASPPVLPTLPAGEKQPIATVGPTDVIPTQYAVEVQVDKNTVATSPAIVVTFRGGNGMAFTDSMYAEVTRPDGSVETRSVQKPQVGTTLDMAGSTGTDRVVVTITLVTGDRYTVIDQLMPFQPLG